MSTGSCNAAFLTSSDFCCTKPIVSTICHWLYYLVPYSAHLCYCVESQGQGKAWRFASQVQDWAFLASQLNALDKMVNIDHQGKSQEFLCIYIWCHLWKKSVSTDFTYLSHWLACTNCLYRDAEFLEDYSIFKSWKFLLGHFFPYTMCLICICRTGGRSYQRPWWYFLVLLMCAPLLLFVVTSLTFPAIFMLAMLMISVKVRRQI